MPTGTDNSHRRLVLGGRPHLEEALAAWIAAVKGGEPLREVVVVTGSNLACGHLSRSVAGHLGVHAGVRFLSIHALAPELAADSLAFASSGADPDRKRLLSPLLRERLVAALVARRAADTGWYFEAVARTPGLPRALARTIDDLREAGVPPDALAAIGSRKGADLAELYGEYVAALRRGGLLDDAGLYALAAAAASRGVSPAAAGVPVALFGIYDLPAMQAGLVATLAADRPFAAFLPWAEGVRPYAAPALAFLESLGLELDDHSDDATATGGGMPQARVSIVSVADDVAERRAAVAEVLRAAAGVAFHDTAVIVADRSRRDQMARALRAHDIPVAARGADDGVSARTCRLLLDCLLPAAGRPLRRDAVIDLAATAPRLDVSADAATVALWDVLSRRARIVADDEWYDRLRRLEYSLSERRARETQAAVDAAAPTAVAASAPDAAAPTAAAASAPAAPAAAAGGSLFAEAPDGAATPVQGSLFAEAPDGSGAAALPASPPPDGAAAAASLREFVGRLAGWRRRLLAARSWPQATHHLVDAARTLCGVAANDPALSALAELADVALVDDAGPRESFGAVARRVLTSLESATDRRVGRDGVAVLSPQQLRGLAFRVVVFCDLAEGGFPPRPAPDPVLPDRERDRIATACGARLPGSADLSAEHDALFALARDATVERFVALYPRLDSSTGRPRLPSRALLGLSRELAARPVAFEELDCDGGLGGLVRRVAGGRGEPVDLRDLDLSVLSAGRGRWGLSSDEGGVSGALNASVRLGEPDAYAGAVLGAARAERGAAAAAGRRRPTLGPYDGVLSAGHATQAAAAVLAGPISPSALEKYLSCPFAFYLRYVLGLEVPDEPEDALSIEPVDLGSLAHEILQGAYAAAAGDEPSAAAVLTALDGVAAAAFARAEARGLTGFPLSWQVVADALLADLRHVVEVDPCWQDGLAPAQFEWWFGGEASKPGLSAGDGAVAAAPELRIGERVVRFHGRVDRIDRGADGRTVRLVDYKTGKGANEAGRVRQGRDVQLPVYVLALLAGGRAPEQVVAEYRMVRRASGFKTVPLSGEPGEISARLATTLGVALAGIESGLYPRWPAYDCKYCDHAERCGADSIAFAFKRRDPRLRTLLDFKEPAKALQEGAS